MPRIYDFSRNPSLSEVDGNFNAYRERRDGAREVSYATLWGPQGLFLFSGIHHQFQLKTPVGQSPYDNDLVDPVFDWLSANVEGDWHWHEAESNNYHSISTSVYLAGQNDISAFQATWGSLFEYNEADTASNARYQEKNCRAEESNTMPSYISVQSMKFMLVHMGGDTGEYFDRLSGRIGFDAMFVDGFDLAISYVLEEDKPSEHGPRMLDGSWHGEILRVFREIGDWVRTGASDALREEMADREIADEGLAKAFRSGLSPAIAQPATSLGL
jgi:hypothetical protein